MDQQIISAIVGIVGGLLGSLLTYWNQRGKLKNEARTEAEKADDIVFERLQVELRRRDARIDKLDQLLREETTRRIRMEAEVSEVRSSFESERALRRELEQKLAEERALRITLEKRVGEQGKKIREQAQQIKELQSENGNLHSQNRELARRLDTQELTKND